MKTNVKRKGRRESYNCIATPGKYKHPLCGVYEEKSAKQTDSNNFFFKFSINIV